MLKKVLLILAIIISIIILFYEKPLKSYYEEKVSNVYYYEDVNGDKVPVPVGFVVSNTDNTVKDGLVIIDNIHSRTRGNEFVWVPCENFERIFYGISKLSRKNYNMNFVDEREYKDIKKSVKRYKGFYIARYESSKSENYVEGIQIASSTKNKFPWIQIPYSGTMNDKYGYSHGSLKVSKYTYKSRPNVNSTLMYPEHYDNIIKWFLSFDDLKNEDNMKITKDDILNNSISLGNYTHIINVTGANDSYCIKNICDLVGNVTEVTPESYLSSYHILRDFSLVYGNSMANRDIIEAYSIYYSTGFRMVLII